ncbi:MAG TPA: hypothetical protein VFV35_01190 [Acidimicrobiales bacterium]|nr:hypothetical protein [Acidimicrobiales bacterium]
MSANRELVELGDLDELARHVERLAAGGWWDDLLELRDLCRKALERGRQLWPISSLAEYRLALDGPGPWAAKVLVAGAGRFTPGPLPEVAAVNHTWEELAPHVDASTPEPTVFAHERVVRGEDLHRVDGLAADVLEVPLRLQPWEPAYPVAEYAADRAAFPVEQPTGFAAATLPARGAPADDAETVRALRDLASAWATESNGRAEAVAVRGPALAAIGALGISECRVAEIGPAAGLSRMAWTAASGGANGRRRGMAYGRFGAWWAAAALAGLGEEWPVDPDELGEAVAELRWFAWEPPGPLAGWTCRLAVEDPADGLAWALDASDAAL